MAEPDRPQMTIRRMSFACPMTKAINTHSELVIRREFPSPTIVTGKRRYVTSYIYYRLVLSLAFTRLFIILIEIQNP